MDDKRLHKLYKIFSKESFLNTGVEASGDNSLYCRLCGADRDLHSFGETYTKEGVVQRYSQLVYECFGVKVESLDDIVCDKCIYQLHMTQQFRARLVAVYAAPSELWIQPKFEIKEKKLPLNYIKKRSTVELIKKTTRTTVDQKWRRQWKSLSIMRDQPKKKKNISCTFCRQRYPMMVPFEGWKNFVCPRCKKNIKPHANAFNKRNIATNNVKDRFEMHPGTDLRGKNRLFTFSKKPSQMSRGDLGTSKYQLRPSRYASRTLTHGCSASEQIVTVHRCEVCGIDMKTWELLNRHMRTHTALPLYRCDLCRRVFKDKILFQTHYLGHAK